MLCFLCHLLEHVVFVLFLTVVLHAWYHYGVYGAAGVLLKAIQAVPGVKTVVHAVLSGEVKNMTQQVKAGESGASPRPPKITLPEKGVVY